ncbi:MAG: PadR family transcriptional regulator [Chlamydiae bacterium]|nr:PadR family transcriptional regulator [Chlamydiota bacterium]
MKKQNKTKFVILGLLTIQPLSGYDMKKLIKESIGYFWSESNGQIYPALNLLLKEKLIKLSDEKSSSKKTRYIYSITTKGLSELKKWLSEDSNKIIHRDETLLKLFFGKNGSKNESIKKLKLREKKVFQMENEYLKIKDHLKEDEASPHYNYWIITLNYGLALAKAELSWCKESIEILQRSSK